MLLPGANETKTVLWFTIIGIRRMCEHKASPTPALTWPVGDLWRGSVVFVHQVNFFQGWMTAIGAKLMVRHLSFFPAGISIWWMTEDGLDFSLLWSYMYCMYCNASFPPSIHPKLVLLQSFEDNLNVSSRFVCFSQFNTHTNTHTHTHTHTQYLFI